jgi:SAM-dependent methyltransferase
MGVVDKLKARFGREVLRYVRPIRDHRNDTKGLCSVCGKDSSFSFNSWVIPDDLFAEWNNPTVGRAYRSRESMFCGICCSSLRVRGFATALLALYGPRTHSVAELVGQSSFRRLDVAEINTIGSMGSLHPFLARLPRLAFSEYHGPRRLGEIVKGSRNEDVSRLTYGDESFDLVVSSDTLEHVPDFRAALRETRRVLRPGGCHVFTVPINASRATTETRAFIDENGDVIHRRPPLMHGRGAGLYRLIPVSKDLLTFTEFGLDLKDHLQTAGFEPEVLRGFDDPHETGAAFVFVGRVPE